MASLHKIDYLPFARKERVLFRKTEFAITACLDTVREQLLGSEFHNLHLLQCHFLQNRRTSLIGRSESELPRSHSFACLLPSACTRVVCGPDRSSGAAGFHSCSNPLYCFSSNSHNCICERGILMKTSRDHITM